MAYDKVTKGICNVVTTEGILARAVFAQAALA
jgi:hypothetical protein